MIVVSEWFPSPSGSDAEGEWIELWNHGPAVNLSGWRLENSAGKKFFLNGTISPDGYLLLARRDTKLVLKNSGETISLYNQSGTLLDQSAYRGVAQEGKSFSRTASGKFLFADPTPGAANVFQEVALYEENISLGAALHAHVPSRFEIVGLAMGVGVLFTIFLIFVVIKDEALHKLLFGGDQEIR